MGLLQGTSVYLIGAIDHAEDPRRWRREIAEELLLPLGVRVYDPLVKPSWFDVKALSEDNYSEIKLFREHLKNPGNVIIPNRADSDRPLAKRLHQVLIEARMQEIRRFCLRMAHNADFIIGLLPKKFTVGTFEEISVAAQAGKPILLCMPDGIDVSTWLPAQIGNHWGSFFDDSFTTMEELYERIRSIDSGDAEVDNFKWIFLSYFNDKVVKNEFPDHQSARD